MTCYPNNPPLMWYQETPRLIGCTACEWTADPALLVADGPRTVQRRGWRHYEALFNRHRIDIHTDTVKQRASTIEDASDPRHGTYAGYRAHMYKGHPPCAPCRDAKTAADRVRKARYRANKRAKQREEMAA